MAGDWLKMTHALPEKPEVLGIAGRTGLNRFEVVGRLFTLWRWFDINTTDGNACGVTAVTLEECLFGYGSNVGFVSAVIAAHWLSESEVGISVVKFDEHISESAKTRGQTAKRVAKSKAKAKGNAEGNADGVTNTVPREEKRRTTTSLRSVESAARATRKCPESFEVSFEMQDWARREVPGVDLKRETEKFRDHTFKTACSDWPGTWRNWMRKSSEFSRSPNRAPQGRHAAAAAAIFDMDSQGFFNA
jgi:chorismate mutase